MASIFFPIGPKTTVRTQLEGYPSITVEHNSTSLNIHTAGYSEAEGIEAIDRVIDGLQDVRRELLRRAAKQESSR